MVVRWSGERQEKVKSQFELDIGGRETCKNAINPLTAALSPVLEQHPLPGKLEGNYRQPYAHSAANCSNVAYKLVLFYRPVLSGSLAAVCVQEPENCETSDLSLPMKTA